MTQFPRLPYSRPLFRGPDVEAIVRRRVRATLTALALCGLALMYLGVTNSRWDLLLIGMALSALSAVALLGAGRAA